MSATPQKRTARSCLRAAVGCRFRARRSGPAQVCRVDGQGADTLARGGRDGVRHGRDRRRHGGFANAGGRVVGDVEVRINLRGVGYVVLNEQIPQIGATSASLTVNMIHVVANVANPLVQLGTNIIVGCATSSLVATNLAGTLDGHAYGTLARVGNVILSGRSAPIEMGCIGTNGALRTESVAQVIARPELMTGLVVDTVTGVANSSSATGETTNTSFHAWWHTTPQDTDVEPSPIPWHWWRVVPMGLHWGRRKTEGRRMPQHVSHVRGLTTQSVARP